MIYDLLCDDLCRQTLDGLQWKANGGTYVAEYQKKVFPNPEEPGGEAPEPFEVTITATAGETTLTMKYSDKYFKDFECSPSPEALLKLLQCAEASAFETVHTIMASLNYEV